ncbi:hypothetical protein [Sphingomonas sp.]|uniref:hypothetical protein n=1 Tax=Sphingomonas sp. TaxID=28214 RepID=UPI0035680028
MSADLKVVQIRTAPLVNDIPGQLRHLATMLESGEVEPMETLMVGGIYPNDFNPYFACFGHNPDRHTTAGFFMHLAKLALTSKDE